MKAVARLVQDPLMRHNAVFFIGSLLVAVLNYIYHPIISRMLTVDEFGELMAIFSLSVQVGAILGVFTLVAVHIATNEDIDSPDKKRSVLEDLYAVVFWVQIIILSVLLALSSKLSSALQFASILPFFLLTANTYISLPYNLVSSFLQGKKEFVRLSIGSLMQAGSKLLFAVLFVVLGAGVGGALGGLLVAQIIALLYFSKWSLKDIRFLPRARPTFDPALFAELRYGLLVFVATSSVGLLYTFDTVIVKYFFPPDVAGEYSGISVIARILFFATASISAVLLPSITLAQTRAENYRILLKSFLLVFVVGGVGLSLMTLFPELIVSLMLGAKYLPQAHLLPSVALVMFFAAFINLLFIFLLALRRYVLIPIALCGIVSLTILVFGGHGSTESIVRHFLKVDVLVLLLLVGYLIYDNTTREQKKKEDLHHHPSL